MAITANLFFIVTAIIVVLYYIVPKKFQWILLLISSYGFYIYAGWKAAMYLFIATVISYIFPLIIASVDEQGLELKDARKKKKVIITFGLIAIIGLFFVVIFSKQYSGLLHSLSNGKVPMFYIAATIGFTYYVLLGMGYMLDAYWGRVPVEKNFFRLALFLAFFPQMFQGPVGRYGRLKELYAAEHYFDPAKFKYAILRIAWGLFKKMIIAEWTAIYADAIFDNPDGLAGITFFGVLFYTVELYADFSGGIDIAIGIGELFGITLDENFKQPLFAISIADLWHRWHVSLGKWFMDYAFYPISLSRPIMAYQKVTKKLFGKKRGRGLAIAAGSILTFLGVSFWHGFTPMAVAWGIYNGVLESSGAVWMPEFNKMKKFFHLNDKSRGYRIFMIFRTFALFNIMNYLDCVSSFSELFHIIKLSVTNFDLSQFMLISAGKLGTAYTPYALITIFISCMIWHYISIRIERGMNFREYAAGMKLPVLTVIVIALLVCIGLFSPISAARGFIYAQF